VVTGRIPVDRSLAALCSSTTYAYFMMYAAMTGKCAFNSANLPATRLNLRVTKGWYDYSATLPAFDRDILTRVINRAEALKIPHG